RQAENLALPHLGDAFQHLVRGQQIEPSQLVVGSPIAPGRTGGAAFPARVVGHGKSVPSGRSGSERPLTPPLSPQAGRGSTTTGRQCNPSPRLRGEGGTPREAMGG